MKFIPIKRTVVDVIAVEPCFCGAEPKLMDTTLISDPTHNTHATWLECSYCGAHFKKRFDYRVDSTDGHYQAATRAAKVWNELIKREAEVEE